MEVVEELKLEEPIVPMPESKSILSMRLKAKNFIQKQKEKDELIEQQQKQEASKSIDPNNFTCKFCNGSIDQKSLKFVHEKFCLVANKNAPQ